MDIVSEPEDATLDRSFIDELAQHPAWKALEERLTDDAAALISTLIGKKPQADQSRESFCAEIDAMRGEIRGLLRVLAEPDVIRRSIDDRRTS